MKPALALGQPPAPNAIRWISDDGTSERRECCGTWPPSDEQCRALVAIKSTLFLYGHGHGKSHALVVSELIDRLAEEWDKRFEGWWAVSATRPMLQVWFHDGLMHARAGDRLTLGRMSRSGEFIEADGGLVAELFNLDAFRGER
jgi:hypothetical protein